MTKSNRLSKGHLTLIFGVPLLIMLFVSYLTTLPDLASQNFFYAVSLDLIITAPLIYFFLIRKTEISKLTVVTMIILGVILGTYTIPEEHQNIINFARYIGVPAIEFSIIGFILFQLRKLVVKYKSTKGTSPDFVTTLRTAVSEVLPKKVAPAFVLEIAMVYYCFFTWKKPVIPINGFTYHKKSGLSLIFGVFVGIILIETFAFHIFVERWSTLIAWIGTCLSLYSMMQVIGIIKSASRRPILLEDEKIMLRFGLLHETEIQYEDIEKIELSRKAISNDPLAKRLGHELIGHNTIIFLKKENTLNGLFGIKNNYTKLMLYVDDRERFKTTIDNRLS